MDDAHAPRLPASQSPQSCAVLAPSGGIPLMTPASLQTCTQKDLAQMARQGGVRGWHSMKKDQLIRAPFERGSFERRQTLCGQESSRTGPAFSAEQALDDDCHHPPIDPACSGGSGRRQSRGDWAHRQRTCREVARGQDSQRPTRSTRPRIRRPKSYRPTARRPKVCPLLRPASRPVRGVLKHLQQVKSKLEQSKNLAIGTNGKAASPPRDRIVVLVRDAFWLHTFWELTSSSIDRARAAMGQEWHLARPCSATLGSFRRGWLPALRSGSSRTSPSTAAFRIGISISRARRKTIASRSAIWPSTAGSSRSRAAMSSRPRAGHQRRHRPALERRGREFRQNLRHERRL